MPLRAVVDTNVLVSGLMATRSAPRQIVDAWLAQKFVLVSSPALIAELSHVLTYPRVAKRLRLTAEEISAFLTALVMRTAGTPGVLQLPGVTRDPKDDKIVACAVEGDAAFIVSGDQDLLVLETYDGIRMLTPQQFMDLLTMSERSDET